jgi:hypothetical protein
MGDNLSSTFALVAARSISKPDRAAQIILGIIWAGSFYSLAMIWCTVALIDRWRGPHGERKMNIFSVFGALLLSIFWPAILTILACTKR